MSCIPPKSKKRISCLGLSSLMTLIQFSLFRSNGVVLTEIPQNVALMQAPLKRCYIGIPPKSCLNRLQKRCFNAEIRCLNVRVLKNRLSDNQKRSRADPSSKHKKRRSFVGYVFRQVRVSHSFAAASITDCRAIANLSSEMPTYTSDTSKAM